ncbi:hypothetical protein [Paenibacillus azoreducens]|uniref:hypothetical protein n=1 Tax=Paenibacillus azoreducens TaxID=116718 RepID=UPI001BB3D7B4|nr:hypothetical protein [Paenibacillus azoreducens]
MYLKAIPLYKLPADTSVHFLKTDLEQMTIDEMSELAASPYRDENWVRLAYSVSITAFRPYIDENFAEIVERRSAVDQFSYSDSTVISTVSAINCLYFDTSYRSPGTCDCSREFKFFSGEHFLGGIGVYAIYLSPDSTSRDKLRSITSIARYCLQSGNPFNRLLIAVVKPDKWELAFAQVKLLLPPVAKTRSCKVTTTLFYNPVDFFQAILSGGEVKDTYHEQHRSRFSF